MTSLATATAFVVDFARSQGKLGQLGKMKTFKILYLADWGKFSKTGETMFDIRWYRIQKGPALPQVVWQDVLVAIASKYGIDSGWQQPGPYPQFMYSVSGPLRIRMPRDDARYLTDAAAIVIDTTADAAGRLTYQTEPMQWLVAEELAMGVGVQFREFRINDIERIKFARLARAYKRGSLGIVEIAREMGKSWTPSNVALFLDEMGANRALPKMGLSGSKRRQVLDALRDFVARGSKQDSSRWVEESVVASQRIEGIHVPLDAFVETASDVW